MAASQDADETGLVARSIEEFGADYVPTLSAHQERQLLQYDYLLSALRGTAPVERVVGHYDRYIDQVAATLRNLDIEDADGSVAALIFAALDGLTLQHAIYDSDARTDAIVERLREVLRLLQERGPTAAGPNAKASSRPGGARRR
jgi:hypothetical protein